MKHRQRVHPQSVHRQSLHRRGFAIMTCVMLIAFVGVAVASMTQHFSAEMDRTRHVTTDAQLRQLLTLATVNLRLRVQTDFASISDKPLVFSVPRALASDGGSVSATLEVSTPTRLQFNVAATLGHQSAAQRIEFRKVDQQWQLHAASLTSRP